MPYTREVWTLASRVKGELTEEHFKIKEEEMRDLCKGEIVCRALYISVDPITRLHIAYSEPGQPILGRQIARVVESKNPDYPKGKLLIGSMGWSSYSTVDPTLTQVLGGHEVPLVETLPRQLENASMPKSAALGLLGVPGLTAYIGLTEVCKARPGETIVISSAAGQMGHLVGQIAKEIGLRVIGYTGSSEKASWIKTELGFDWAFNYKTQDVAQTLKIAAPEGVDIFWDAVGGSLSTNIINNMAIFGRIILVGNLASYGNLTSPSKLSMLDLAITLKEISITGVNVYRYYHLWDSGRQALLQLFCLDITIYGIVHVKLSSNYSV
ncbi:prostaglandin reductase 1 isoform X2 [Eurytemora carolleeae]|uniref:prostaglandin reductase 1 isoform X2 n=1 Tax=Eurytemora carolleeae TaxID=1294199 RepID=UPI000C76AE42|nr:prostaglandin reductase 1 isoform X2 [Eurytemora carolleeae]|eukprot:XP_023328257.1 prostaglandin reductase 1-like isoform X2 [Eurytemora affinis]